MNNRNPGTVDPKDMADPKDLSTQDSHRPTQADQAEQPDTDDGTPARVSTAISSGKPLDEVGGAGLGQAPGAGDHGGASAPQSQEKIAADPQDRRDKS
ncbi:MAG: hypothetical protein ACJ8G3_05430 [Burkholderiaceae bacterium]